LAILALILIIFKSKKELLEGKKTSWLLVLAVFFGTGLVDTIINVAGKRFDFSDFNKGFPLVCFAIAAFGGTLVLIFVKKSKFEFKNLVGGFLLGIPNYFSIYTLMEGLTYYKGNAAIVYPIVHILSILLASFIAFLWFKEKLSLVNYVGAFFAIAAVLLLSL
jgi:drug/metabolite transporter (DMT)-like permease